VLIFLEIRADNIMATFHPREAVIVSKESVESPDPSHIVWSNNSFLRALSYSPLR